MFEIIIIIIVLSFIIWLCRNNDGYDDFGGMDY